MRVKTITVAQYRQLTQGGRILQGQGQRNKEVVELPNGDIVKCFTYKKRWIQNVFQTKLSRFLKKAKRLKKYGILAVDPNAAYHCPERDCYIVCYPKIPGHSVRELLRQLPDLQAKQQLMEKTIAFLALLHEKHIYFRGAHLGNLILTDQNQFALIDMSNLRFFINPRRRAANVSFCLTHREDIVHLSELNFDTIISHYFAHVHLTNKPCATCHRWLILYLTKQLAHYQEKGLLHDVTTLKLTRKENII